MNAFFDMAPDTRTRELKLIDGKLTKTPAGFNEIFRASLI
jgi:hypothetical protein